MYFEMENGDKVKAVKNVRIELIDVPTFYNPGGVLCNSNPGNVCRTNICSSSACILQPLEQKQAYVNLKAPSVSDIGNLRQTFEIKYKIDYDFEASTTYPLFVINSDELLNLQRSGKSIGSTLVTSIGSGPIKIDVRTADDSTYAISGTDVVLLFTVQDYGSGSILNSKIDPGHLIITFPAELSGRITRDSAFGCSGATCQNNQVIELYQGESRPLYFRIQVPQVEIYKTMQVLAHLSYTYELRESKEVSVWPRM
jgi:hypothetical protein